MIVTNLRARDPGLPSAADFETLDDWLAAMPPYTIMLWTHGEGPFRMTVPYIVEDLIDGLALGPFIEAKFAEAFRQLEPA